MSDYNTSFIPEDQLRSLAFAVCGRNVKLDTSVRLVGVENISLGDNVRIDAGTIIIATGPVHIGSHVHISANCYLAGRGGIVIHDFANLSFGVSLHSVSDDASGKSMTNPTVPDRFKNLIFGQIILNKHSLLFAKSTVLPGVTVGIGAVLAAHSLANRTIPAWAIYAGSPARSIGERSRDLLLLEETLLVEGY